MAAILPHPNWIMRWLITAIVISTGTVLLALFRIYSNGPVKPLQQGLGTMENRIDLNKEFTIMLWAHGPRMVRRFVRSYGKVDRDPFAECKFKNCHFRIDNLQGLNVSDAVLIHLHQTKGPHDLPPVRSPKQRWIFFTDESPYNTFLLTKKYSMKDYNGLFNWSMTYRSDSDISAAYGRTVAMTQEEKIALGALPNYFKVNDKLVAVMGSNCGGLNRRWPYIHEMEKHIDIDSYGGCGRLKCPGHFNQDCPLLINYKFYLAFENCNCREYMTEKLWWNAYAKEAVPVVMGGPKEYYTRLCPPNSFIHVDDFDTPAELSKYLIKLSKDEKAYNAFFAWKRDFKVVNEHGYFGTTSKHLCHICEALNANRPNKVYTNLEKFWSSKEDCVKAKWKAS